MTDHYTVDPGAWPYAPQAKAPVGLAVASAVIAVGMTVVEICTAVAAPSAASTFREALLEGQDTFDVFTLYDALELLLFPVMVAAYVVSCLWLQFARRTALVIRPGDDHQRSAVWVWLGWWVPIVSLWFPYQVVRDVRDGTYRRGVEQIGLGLWWTAWLVYVIGNRVTSSASTSADPDMVGMLTFFEVVTAVAVTVACVQWCRIVHRITADQQAALSPR